ncbi:Fur family transcriptional regulator [Comamonas terrigena]|uniref:Fur family transcriptional regulator n=1 Tax=Comamonas terrigena TaxID=32013 RepID=UPI0028AAA93C|nr:transcriptional repressor [Comamonas terrigena]
MPRPASSVELFLPPGMRATRATRALVALLRSQAASRLSAAEVEAALARLGVAVNRVTVFRALDRLTQAGLLQRRVEDDRITRFQWRSDAGRAQASAAPAPVAQRMPVQFHCLRCAQDLPVDSAAPAVQASVQALGAALEQTAVGQLQTVQLHGLCTPCSVA